jgi:hypothetical protein
VAGPDIVDDESGDLSEEDFRTALAQFSQVKADSQKEYDSSIRTLAAAGVAVTTSLGTALEAFPGRAVIAVICFLGSLVCTLVSFGSTQLDMNRRAEMLNSGRYGQIYGNRWTKTTTILNLFAGGTFIAGGALLAAFVKSAT